MTLELLGLCGALRTASLNRLLMQDAARRFDGNFQEANLRLPLYDGDLEDEGLPAEVQALADQIKAADAVLIVTPEYNQSFSGVLKNALDWVSRVDGQPWKGKPVALMSAAAGRTGGARANYALRLAMAPFRTEMVPGPEVLIAGASKEFDAEGRLTNPRYIQAIEEAMGDLHAWAVRANAG